MVWNAVPSYILCGGFATIFVRVVVDVAVRRDAWREIQIAEWRKWPSYYWQKYLHSVSKRHPAWLLGPFFLWCQCVSESVSVPMRARREEARKERRRAVRQWTHAHPTLRQWTHAHPAEKFSIFIAQSVRRITWLMSFVLRGVVYFLVWNTGILRGVVYFLVWNTGLFLEVLQYEVNPWKGRGRPQPPFRLTKIGIISLQSVGLRSRD